MDNPLKLENQLCFRLYTASRLITQAYRPMLEALGLTYPQYLVMMVLWEKDGQPVNDIAKRRYLETNTVTPLLKRMEKEGLLERSRGTEDARQVIARLTEQGRDLKKKAAPIPGRMGASITCDRFTGKEAGTMARWLDEIIQTLS